MASADDSANLLLLLQDLRTAIGNKMITAAVGIKPWLGADKMPLTDVSEYAKVLDSICGLYSPFFNGVLTCSRLRQF